MPPQPTKANRNTLLIPVINMNLELCTLTPTNLLKMNLSCYAADSHVDTVLCEYEGENVTFHREEFLKPTDGLFWVYLGTYVVLVLFAGLMSGLTMGLLSLDIMSLEVLTRGGKPRQKKYAKRILHIVRRHHLLLVTLLLANAIAVEAMPIFLSKITNEIVAIVVSVTAVLLFGEIIPQALCTRYGLAIGYYCSPLVFVILALFYPIAFPMALLLDCILGKDHGTFFRRAELRELVKMHGDSKNSNEEPLSYDEVLIVKSALEMRDKTVEDIMTPLESVYMLDVKSVIDGNTMKELVYTGHSRVPIFEGSRDNVCGMLLVKRLIHLDPRDRTLITSLEGAHSPPPSCLTTMPLYDLLNHFQTGRSHLSLVYEQKTDTSEPQLKGIITLEDVIEELIGEEIVDETDLYVDVHRRIAVARARLSYTRKSVSEPARPRKERKKIFRRSWSQPQMKAQSPLAVPGQREGGDNTQQLTTIAEIEEPAVLSTSVPTVVRQKSPEDEVCDDENFGDYDLEHDDTAPLIMTIN